MAASARAVSGLGRRATSLAVAVVALGGAVGLASRPVPTVLLCVGYLGGCLLARIERRWLWLSIAPLAVLLGCPWPVAALCGWAAATGAWTTLVRPQWVRGWQIRRLALTTAVTSVCAGPAAAVTYRQFSADPLVITRDQPAVAIVISAVLALSVLNATAEELLWRHALHDLLRRAGLPLATTVGLVSISFGLAHLNGIPSGLMGVGGAAMLAVVLSGLRMRLGLRYAIVAHAIIDVVVLGVLASQTLWLAGS